MKKTSCLLALFLSFSGAVSATSTSIKPNIQIKPVEISQPKSLDDLLLKDAEDGKIDMNFERAVLIASGIQPELLDKYEEKINELAAYAASKVRDIKDDYEKARAIFSIFQQEFKVEDNFFQPWQTLETGKGNCLSLAVLFDIVCEKNGIKAGYMGNFEHIFNFVEGNPRKLIDLTNSKSIPDEKYLEDEELSELSRTDMLARSYIWRASSFSEQKKIFDEEEMLLRAVTISSTDASAVFNVAMFYRFQSRYDEALSLLDKFIDYNPERVWPYLTKAHILIYQDKYQETIEVLKKLYSLYPKEEITDTIKEIEEKAKAIGELLELEKKLSTQPAKPSE